MTISAIMQLAGYVLTIAFCSWMGRRFGAYAVVGAMLPLPVASLQVGLVAEGRSDEIVRLSLFATASVIMVVSWALCFRLAMGLVARWLPAAASWQRAVASLALALVLATGAAVVHLPVSVALSRGDLETMRIVTPALSALALLVAVPLLRARRAADAPVVPAHLSGLNLALRFAVILALLAVGKRAPEFHFLAVLVLGSFPRGTAELVFGTWLDNDEESAREVLSSLPTGLVPPLVWVGSIPFTVPGLGVTLGLAVSAACSALVWVVNAWRVVTSPRTYPLRAPVP